MRNFIYRYTIFVILIITSIIIYYYNSTNKFVYIECESPYYTGYATNVNIEDQGFYFSVGKHDMYYPTSIKCSIEFINKFINSPTNN